MDGTKKNPLVLDACSQNKIVENFWNCIYLIEKV